MTQWTIDELARIGGAEELQLASARLDGTLRPYVTMWVVRADDDLYVRSAYGPDNPWFRRAKTSGTGRIRAGGLERDVIFADAAPDVHAAIDAAYHAEYDRYGPQIVGSVVGSEAAAVTIRLVPRGDVIPEDVSGGNVAFSSPRCDRSVPAGSISQKPTSSTASSGNRWASRLDGTSVFDDQSQAPRRHCLKSA
jgi:hypothetical protein